MLNHGTLLNLIQLFLCYISEFDYAKACYSSEFDSAFFTLLKIECFYLFLTYNNRVIFQ
jgi:hypothetical protein